MSSANLLLKRAEEITALNSQAGKTPIQPLIVAAQSPLHELLICEIASTLPAPLADHLRSAPTVLRVQDWLAAGAVFNLVADDSHLAQKFVENLGTNPKHAALAAARAFASRMEPPPRGEAWHRRDRTGLALQIVVAFVTLAVRSLLFSILGYFVVVSQPLFALGIKGLVGFELLSGDFSGSFAALAVYPIAALWLTLEAVIAPRLMEQVRQFPARQNGAPPPLTWRADAFYAFWFTQSAVLLFLLTLRSQLQFIRLIASAEFSAVHWAMLILIELLFVGTLWIIGQFAKSTLVLGTAMW